MRYLNRVAIITGGARGIGRGCAQVFLEQGAFVALFDRDKIALEQLMQEWSELFPGRISIHQVDVAREEEIEDAIAATVEQFGRLDCLVNNAGIHPPDTPLESMTPGDAMRVMQINFASTYIGCYHAMKHLRKTKGTIINMSSMTAVLGQRNSTAYAASKGAQLSFTKALALEAAADGIRVNAILPSNVDTPLMREWASSLPDPEAALQRIAALQPLGRMATIQEIGQICFFLASDDSSFMTGQAIEADGGAALDY